MTSGCCEVSQWGGSIPGEGESKCKGPEVETALTRELAVFKGLSFVSKTDQGSLWAVVRRRQPWPFQRPPGRIRAV